MDTDEFAEFDTTNEQFDAMADDGDVVDSYVDDEPVEDVLGAFERGEKGVTARPPGWGNQSVLPHYEMTGREA